MAAEIPPNRKRYRVTGVVRLRPLRGPRSDSHHSQKEPRAILSSGVASNEVNRRDDWYDWAIGVSGDRGRPALICEQLEIAV